MGIDDLYVETDSAGNLAGGVLAFVQDDEGFVLDRVPDGEGKRLIRLMAPLVDGLASELGSLLVHVVPPIRAIPSVSSGGA